VKGSLKGRCVVDASAFLAFEKHENGAPRVAEALACGVVMSAVNWAEVQSKWAEWGKVPDEAQRLLLLSAIEIVPFDLQVAEEVARLRGQTRRANLSLGDRGCLATARLLGLPVLTADRAWADIDLGIVVETIR